MTNLTGLAYTTTEDGRDFEVFTDGKEAFLFIGGEFYCNLNTELTAIDYAICAGQEVEEEEEEKNIDEWLEIAFEAWKG